MNYSYLTPPSKAKRIRLPQKYIYEEIGAERKRRIFGKLPYTQYQIQHINKLKEYLSKKSPYMNYSNELLLRFNYSGNFLLSKITEKVKQYDEWHQNQVITNLQRPGREILENGHIYAFGRDYDYCPVVIIRAGAIDLTKYSPEDYFSATANLLEPIESYMLVPGVIEKWNVLVDFENKKCSFYNQQLLSKCLVKVAAAYPYRLKRLLFLNSNSQHSQIKAQITKFVADESSEAEVVSISSWQELRPLIPEDEREKKYGGGLGTLCEYWPIHTTNKYEQSQSAEESEAEYKTVVNDLGYFQPEKTPFCDCGSGKCLIY